MLTMYVCLQNFIIDGSPQWEIYRTVPVSTSAITQPAQQTAVANRKGAQSESSQSTALRSATAGGLILNSQTLRFEVTV